MRIVACIYFIFGIVVTRWWAPWRHLNHFKTYLYITEKCGVPLRMASWSNSFAPKRFISSGMFKCPSPISDAHETLPMHFPETAATFSCFRSGIVWHCLNFVLQNLWDALKHMNIDFCLCFSLCVWLCRSTDVFIENLWTFWAISVVVAIVPNVQTPNVVHENTLGSAATHIFVRSMRPRQSKE